MATTNLGRVTVVAQGEYNPTTQYEKLDIVWYAGTSYLVRRAVKGVVPVDGADYALLAGRGESAYEVAVDNGYVGSESDWLAYIRADGSISALQKFMTNDSETEVSVPEYGNIPSLQGYISQMFTNGGLPAEPFETKAQMEIDGAALADGQYAMVTNDTANNGLYVKTAGVWVKSAYDPLAQAKTYTDDIIAPISDVTNALSRVTPKDLVFSIVDYAGNAAVGLKADGGVVASELETQGITTDRLNRVNIKYEQDKLAGNINLDTEISIVLSYGQSLSQGIVAYTTRETNVPNYYGSLQLNTGILYSDTTPTSLDVIDKSYIVVASNMVHDLLEADDGLTPTDYNYKFVYCATGKGSTKIIGLIKGTTNYNNSIDAVQKIKTLANARGEIAKVQAWYWTQGEADATSTTTKQEYKTYLSTLIDDFSVDIKAVTQQKTPVSCISYQTRIFGANALKPDVALAQLELSNEREDYHIACPMYHVQGYNPVEDVHPEHRGYSILAAYYGLVHKKAVIDGDDWKPLQPISAESIDNSILVKFHVPVGKLVFDTEYLPEYEKMGFTLYDSLGEKITITDVSIINTNTVKLTSANTLQTGDVIKYGHGAGGNLRDEQGKYYTVNVLGSDIPLHNWCLISYITII